MQSEFITVEDELEQLRSAIKETVMRRERLEDAMKRWYASQPGKRFPQKIELVSLDEKLSWLDSRFKQLWDGQHS
jgi:hypothetical protein